MEIDIYDIPEKCWIQMLNANGIFDEKRSDNDQKASDCYGAGKHVSDIFDKDSRIVIARVYRTPGVTFNELSKKYSGYPEYYKRESILLAKRVYRFLIENHTVQELSDEPNWLSLIYEEQTPGTWELKKGLKDALDNNKNVRNNIQEVSPAPEAKNILEIAIGHLLKHGPATTKEIEDEAEKKNASRHSTRRELPKYRNDKERGNNCPNYFYKEDDNDRSPFHLTGILGEGETIYDKVRSTESEFSSRSDDDAKDDIKSPNANSDDTDQNENGESGMNKPVSIEGSKNIILYGPPGTGKTYNSVIYAVELCKGTPFDQIESMINNGKTDYSSCRKNYEKFIDQDQKRIVFTTFHQSYGYEEFIEGIKPETDDNGQLRYVTKDGIFKQFCNKARGDEDNNYVFIINEINRGNISKILGELITLIEPSKRGGTDEKMSASLPYSNKDFSVPKNVYIIGTMNTADRSLTFLDTALRRRFDFIEMMPKPELLRKVDLEDPRKEGQKTELDLKKMLSAINTRIEYLYDREHTIGHAFFMPLVNRENPTINDLATIFRNKIIPLLQEYFYDDYEKIQLVLGDKAKDDKHKFVKTIDVWADEDKKGYFRDFGFTDLDSDDKKIYEINPEAFDKIESYIQIYQKRDS